MTDTPDTPPGSADPVSSVPQRATLAGMLCGLAAGAVAFVPGVAAAARQASLLGDGIVSPAAGNAAIAAGLGALAGWVCARTGSRFRSAVLLTAGAGLCLTQSRVLGLYGLAWEPLSAIAAMTAGGLVALALSPEMPGPARWFGGRLSRTGLDGLAAAADRSWQEPALRPAAVVSCRLLNETRLREQYEPTAFLKLCEAFRATAGRVLTEHQGCLGTGESSSLHAFFGLPLPVTNPADAAAAAAVALDDALRDFALSRMDKDHEPPAFGIGVATGMLTAGLTGDDYTAAGDAVEISRWLAARNGDYHTRMLIEQTTRQQAELIEERPLEILHPPEGAAVEVYQLLGTLGSLSPEARARRDAFRDAIMLLRAGHAQDALQRFADASAGLLAPDLVLQSFIAQAQEQALRDRPKPATGPTPPPSAAAAPEGESAPAPAPARRKGKPSNPRRRP